jgi:hypothetical protein
VVGPGPAKSFSSSRRILLGRRSSSAVDRETTSPFTSKYTGSRIHSESRYANTEFTSLFEAWKSRHSTNCFVRARKRSLSLSRARCVAVSAAHQSYEHSEGE